MNNVQVFDVTPYFMANALNNCKDVIDNSLRETHVDLRDEENSELLRSVLSDCLKQNTQIYSQHPWYARDIEFFTDVAMQTRVAGPFDQSQLGGVFFAFRVGSRVFNYDEKSELWSKLFWTYRTESYSEYGDMKSSNDLERMLQDSYKKFLEYRDAKLAQFTNGIHSLLIKIQNQELITINQLLDYSGNILKSGMLQQQISEVENAYAIYSSCLQNQWGLYDTYCGYATVEAANKLFLWLALYYGTNLSEAEFLEATTFNDVKQTEQENLTARPMIGEEGMDEVVSLYMEQPYPILRDVINEEIIGQEILLDESESSLQDLSSVEVLVKPEQLDIAEL